ncbi:hypothetical protein KXX16_001819 [Aspergillus fumigatus]|nr:hypothetical protein KXX16_001819 [Aspergillus fumigatus]KAH2389679.1 hypothetical protein KXW92_001843 [Aspergillus fumigatus]KAH3140293.1 hypothetical protein KXW80_001941 [Aspergillus fumigatus]KAH3371321.1 hypothetical protein KXW99_000338 [Aspergillus fumigatus]
MRAKDPNRRNDAGPLYHPVGPPESRAPTFTETESPRGHVGADTGWKLEILACLVFLTALAAMVATLYPHQGKPLPQWPFRVSINTLLSIYGGVMKAATIYVVGSCVGQLQWSWFSSERPLIDLSRLADLSHGDLFGAFRWLWSNHIREPFITLGAIVAIASLAFEPFIQQLTSYGDCSVPLKNLRVAPNIPRTNYIVQRSGVSSAQSGDPEIAQAILLGLVGGPNLLASTGCTTGNCTFPTAYTSAGICSTCEDISSNITVTKTCRGENSSVVDCANATYQQSLVWADRITSASYGGVELTNVSWTPMQNESLLFHVDTALYPQWSKFVMFGVVIVWGETTYSQAKVNPLTTEPLHGCEDPSTNNTWACRGYGSAYCKLRFCTRTYNASVEAGILVENNIEESPSSTKELGSPPPEALAGASAATLGLLDLRCINDVELRELRNVGYNISSASPRWAGYGVDHDLFQLDGNKFQTNWFYVAGALSGNVSTGRIQSSRSTIGPKVLQNIEPLSTLSGDGGPILLYSNSKVDFGSISAKLSNVATHMTTMVRQTGNVNHSAPAEGVVFHYATCLNVHWIWIILPSIAAGCVVALLAAVILLTAHGGTRIWKGNVLALLFHGPGGAGWSSMPVSDEDGDNVLSKLNTNQGMEQRAREIKVKLDQSSDSAQLLKAGEMK